ncbi:MAG: hypothetical protein D6732_00490, partial [Methanobacteriota archaeon]
TAVDNESPPNESVFSNEAQAFVGTTPNFLVWVGPTVAGPSADSGDSLFQALVANGESAFLTNDLFQFGTDLSVFEGIFVVLGIYPDNYVLPANSPEALALDTYLANGGNLYLEGGDCYFYDPQFAGGHDINPWFDCNPLSDGSADVFNLMGINDLSGFQFPYNGANNFMDELSAITSTEIWQETTSGDIQGLFFVGYAGGSGRSIGVVPSFGGMTSTLAALSPVEREARPVAHDKTTPMVKETPERRVNPHFVKKAAYYPELKTRRSHKNPLYKITPRGLQVMANTQVDLMAAYLDLFRTPPGPPQIAVSDSVFMDTLLVNASTTEILTISNVGGTLASDLTFFITENPDEPWLTVSPLAGTLAGNESMDIT